MQPLAQGRGQQPASRKRPADASQAQGRYAKKGNVCGERKQNRYSTPPSVLVTCTIMASSGSVGKYIEPGMRSVPLESIRGTPRYLEYDRQRDGETLDFFLSSLMFRSIHACL